MLNNSIQYRKNIICRFFPIRTHPTVFSGAIYGREIKLLLCCIKTEHKVKNHFLYFTWTAVRLVNFIYHHNRFQSHLDCLLENKTSLWHRTFKCIYEQKTSVCHIKNTLHFTTKISVSRSVYNIDFISFIINRYVFRQYCNTSFSFKVIVIKN